MVSLALLTLTSTALFVYLAKQTIFVDKIANVTIVSKQEAEHLGAGVVPISEIGSAVASGEPTVLTGYTAKVTDVCKKQLGALPGNPIILLTKADDGYAAVKTTLNAKVCSLFLRKEDSKNPVWVVADQAFRDVDSSPAYVMLNKTTGANHRALRFQ